MAAAREIVATRFYKNSVAEGVAAIIRKHQAKEIGELVASFRKLAADMRAHSEAHAHDYNQLAASVEGVCADRIEFLLSRYPKV
jgi:signal transduction histidine kinase